MPGLPVVFTVELWRASEIRKNRIFILCPISVFLDLINSSQRDELKNVMVMAVGQVLRLQETAEVANSIKNALN